MATASVYMAQCLNGHVWSIEPGSDLEQQAIAREERGFIDAIVVSTTDCRECQEDRELADRQFRSMCLEDGCRQVGCRSETR